MPRERKVSTATCEAGKVVEVTLSFHPAAFKLIEKLREQGLHGTTDALVCTGLVLEALRARFPLGPLPARLDAARRRPRAAPQPWVGMSYREVAALDIGDCPYGDEQGEAAANCQCDACVLAGSFLCNCGVLWIEHPADDAEFSLMSWKAVPGILPPPPPVVVPVVVGHGG